MSKKTFDIAQSNENKLIIQLKENQKGLLQNCNDIIRFSQNEGMYQTTGEKNRNRIEERTVEIYGKQNSLIENTQWAKHIKTIILVEHKTHIYNTKENIVYMHNILPLT